MARETCKCKAESVFSLNCRKRMLGLSKNHRFSIGVDMSNDALKAAQLVGNGKGVRVLAIGNENRPADVEAGSSGWQRWAVEAVRRLTCNGGFRGKEIIAALPASDVYVEHMKMPKTKDGSSSEGKARDAAFSKMKSQLPFDPGEAIVKYVPTADDNVVVVATERHKIDRYLAIYEKANLRIKSIAIWPEALVSIYTSLFGRRKDDLDTIVMLIDMESECTNVVICRHSNLLFAHSIPIGSKKINAGQDLNLYLEIDKGRSDVRSDAANLERTKHLSRLGLEVTACRQRFESMFRRTNIERLIFLSGRAANKDICAAIAKQLQIPAQIGDCLSAVEPANIYDLGVDRRQPQISWATAFGLSLQCKS